MLTTPFLIILTADNQHQPHMTVSDKLYISRLSVGVFTVVALSIGYAIFTVYSNEINEEVAKALNDSFGHLKGELANL